MFSRSISEAPLYDVSNDVEREREGEGGEMLSEQEKTMSN
jgi:hypothetical protein